MAIFTNAPNQAGPEQRRRADQTTLSIVAKDLTIVGDLTTEGVIKVEGRVQGSVRAGSQVLIAPGATVEGDLHTREAVIGGQVTGAVRASERAEIQSTAVVTGDIHTRKIVVVEGGRVNGEIKMGEATSPKPGVEGAGTRKIGASS